jgi:uncharacterized membrane protein
MPFALITIGVLLFFTAINRTAGALGQQVAKDLFSTDGGFVYWAAGLVIVGLIGYIPTLKKPSDMFMALIILAMLLQNKGFFSQLQQGLQSGVAAAGGTSTAAATPSTSTASPTTGLFSGPLGSMLIASQNASAGIGTGPLSTTTQLPGSTLDTGGIGAA